MVLGAAVSSAILYLAIIAIWAGFLVPAWVRRPHARADDDSDETEFTDETELSYASEGTGGGEPPQYVTDTENDVEVMAAAGVHVEVSEYAQDGYEYHEVEYREEEYVAASYEGDDGYGDGYEAEEPAAAAGPGSGEAGYGPQDPRPSQSREQMLRARRRMLAILAGMTFVTMAFTALGLVSWWICIPPAGLLVLYMLLLREIAMADAELARKRSAWEHAEAAAYARHLHAVAEREAYEASLAQPEPEAEIIDISGRVADADQLYDQYADAAVRAVGD